MVDVVTCTYGSVVIREAVVCREMHWGCKGQSKQIVDGCSVREWGVKYLFVGVERYNDHLYLWECSRVMLE